MEQYGVIIGVALLVVVGLCGWLLGAQAHSNVRRFNEEHHKSFLGRGRL